MIYIWRACACSPSLPVSVVCKSIWVITGNSTVAGGSLNRFAPHEINTSVNITKATIGGNQRWWCCIL